MVKGSTTNLGTGGAGNRAARSPVAVSRFVPYQRPANDNPPPPWLRFRQVLTVLGVIVAATSLFLMRGG